MRSSWNTILRSVLLYALLLALSAAFLAPFVWMLSVSVQDIRGVFAQPFQWLPERPQWENYSQITSLLPFWRYAANTVLVTVLVLAGTLLSSSLVAYGFSRLRFRGRETLFAVCLATMMLDRKSVV